MTSPTTTKAERNARVLNAIILDGEAMSAELMAEARARMKDEPTVAAKLLVRWDRVSRRAMQAMALDEKFDRAAATEARDAASRARGAADPLVAQRRADILRTFRTYPDGLDFDQELELKTLLDEMDDDEFTGYSVIQNMRRICKALGWTSPDDEADAPGPPPSGEVSAEPATEGVLPDASTASNVTQLPRPEGPPQPLRGSSPEGGAPTATDAPPSEPERSLIWRQQMALIERQRAERDAERRRSDTS